MPDNVVQESQPAAEAYRFRFGLFELDTVRLQLRRDGRVLEIEPKPLEVLSELVRNAGELVTKNELMDSVWAGRIVTESVIARCINKLRAVLEDTSQSLIFTVHGYGYRFTATPQKLSDDAAALARLDTLPPLAAGDRPSLRPHWRLTRALDERGGVWLAEHDKTRQQRVFKFALRPERIGTLKRELTIHRLLQRALNDRDDMARLLDYNLEMPPYFLELEYCVDGSLADWLAAQGGAGQVPLPTRLDLIAQAAEALAAAHALGVLHLDIKPSNLLIRVGRDRQPRILWTDFGSSRLLEPGRLTELGITQLGTLRTQLGAASSDLGTLIYLSPEVMGGKAPTALADVYALGVMLYQLAAGDLRKPLASGWEIDIADEVLREDIAAATNGDPANRLASARELAGRLRSLEQRRDALAQAREASARAQALQAAADRAKARRPWLIAVVSALVAGLALSLWFYRGAVRARDAASNQAAVAQAVTEFLNRDVLGAATQYNVSTRTGLTVVEAVDRAVAGLNGQFKDQPLTEAAIRLTIGSTYTELSRNKQAEEQIQKAIDLFRSSRGPTDRQTLGAEFALVRALIFDSRYIAARAVLDRIDADLADSPVADPGVYLARDALSGGYFYHSGQYDKAAPLYEQALAEQIRLDPTDTAGIVSRRDMLAATYGPLGRFAEADALFQKSFIELRQINDSDGTDMALEKELYAELLFQQRRYAQAEQIFGEVKVVLARNLGAENSSVAESLAFLGRIYLSTGRTTEAEAASRSAYASYLLRYGPDNSTTLAALGALGMAELAVGKKDQGLPDLQQSVTGLTKVVGAEAPDTEYMKYQLAKSGLDTATQLPATEKLVAGLSVKPLQFSEPGADWVAKLDVLRARLLLAKGQHSEARELLGRAVQSLQKTSPDDPDTASAVTLLAAARP